ncbi:MAG: hypothetical protein ACTSUE_10640, partial [Promethearchaeota archaeon]
MERIRSNPNSVTKTKFNPYASTNSNTTAITNNVVTSPKNSKTISTSKKNAMEGLLKLKAPSPPTEDDLKKSEEWKDKKKQSKQTPPPMAPRPENHTMRNGGATETSVGKDDGQNNPTSNTDTTHTINPEALMRPPVTRVPSTESISKRSDVSGNESTISFALSHQQEEEEEDKKRTNRKPKHARVSELQHHTKGKKKRSSKKSRAKKRKQANLYDSDNGGFGTDHDTDTDYSEAETVLSKRSDYTYVTDTGASQALQLLENLQVNDPEYMDDFNFSVDGLQPKTGDWRGDDFVFDGVTFENKFWNSTCRGW